MDTLEKDIIFKGLTRPAMIFGIPIVPFISTSVLMIIIGIWTTGWVFLFFFFMLFLMREVTKTDDFIFHLLFLKLKSMTAKKNTKFYNEKTYIANSYRRQHLDSGFPLLSIVGLDKVPSIEKFIPYSSVVANNVVITKEYKFLCTWKLKGVAFEVENLGDTNKSKNVINMLIKSFSTENISFYTHATRNSIMDSFTDTYDNTYLSTLSQQYYEGFTTEDSLKENAYYITLVYTPLQSKIETSFFTKLTPQKKQKEITHYVKKLNEITDRIETDLQRFGPHRLAEYTKNEIVYNKQLEFYNFLISGTFSKVRKHQAPIYTYLTGNLQNIQFGKSMIQINFNSGHKKFARIIEFKEYSDATYAGILDALMYTDIDYTMTQSYASLPRIEAKDKLAKQQKQLLSSEDDAMSEVDGLNEALDQLTTGKISFGYYHFSLIVYGNSIQDTKEKTNQLISTLSLSGFTATLADIALPSSYFAQFPTNDALRPRVSLLHSQNYSGLIGLHTFPKGKRDHNCWGEAAMILKTPNKQPYYFNLHQESKEDDFGQHFLANTLVIGQSGGGKTAFLSFLMNMMLKYDNEDTFPQSIDKSKRKMTAIYLDKDKGALANILAAGGTYLSVESGKPSGFNPFMCDNTATNINHLQNLMKILVTRADEKLNSSEETRLADAINAIMNEFEKEERSYPITLMMENLTDDINQDNSIKERLRLWQKGHKFGWVFDNAVDEFDIDNNDMNIYGIDGTEFLDDKEVRGALSYYILWRVMSLMDGRRLGIFIDEAWKWIEEESIAEEIKNKLKTNRKLNAFFVLAVQSVEDFLKNTHARAIVEQSATMVFFTNPKAIEEEYIKGLSCTKEEYHAIKEIDPNSYQFLIKKDHNRVMATLDLSTVDPAYIKILSTSKPYVDRIETIFNQSDTPLDEKLAQLKQIYTT